MEQDGLTVEQEMEGTAAQDELTAERETESIMEQGELAAERYALALGRLREIAAGDCGLAGAWQEAAAAQAGLLLLCAEVCDACASGQEPAISQLKRWNAQLYEDILPGRYERSWCHPGRAVEALGRECGQLVAAVAAELRSAIPYAYEGEREPLLIRMELLLELCGIVEAEPETPGQQLREALYYFIRDYYETECERRVAQLTDPGLDFARRIVEGAELSGTDYLYRYGEYVTENELRLAAYINALPQAKIERIAETYTEGYRLGFVNGGKDLSIKRTVNIRYPLGLERVIREAIGRFAKMGLSPVMYRAADSLFTGRGVGRNGYYGAAPNRQYAYDHREDIGLILDGQLVTRRLECLEQGYRAHRQQAKEHAGPAVMETFGELPFAPRECAEAVRLTPEQQELAARFRTESARITNTYIPGEERSFTIISFPVPEIAQREGTAEIDEARFAEIFDAVLRINTLDYAKYQRIQQTLIDTLDTARSVHIRGMGENRTELSVALARLEDPARQSIYENCVADVNIPVGEVFTTPVLEGTNGLLHVSRVYLNGLEYRDLSLRFTDGMVTDYACANYEDAEENRRYIEENVLYHHRTLPMGEAAIGTNTLAYTVARRYGIEDRLPILIAEKTGPHFAVGDTCYSHAEDVAVYNPDGKECIARDNTISLRRGDNPQEAYFGCHTDVTLPYDELGLLEAVRGDGTSVAIIRNGRFVLPGTEELNEPLEAGAEV